MSKRVSHVATTGMFDKLSRGEEASMADTHYPHLFPRSVLVQYALHSSSIRSVSFGEHARHVFYCVGPDLLAPVLLCDMVVGLLRMRQGWVLSDTILWRVDTYWAS